MIRNAAAIVVGLITAFIVITLTEELGDFLYPPSTNIDPDDVAASRAYFSQLPLMAQLFPIFAYVIGTFSGSLIACFIGTARPAIFAFVVGLFVLAWTISSLIWIPHPHWFSALAIVSVVAGAWLATWLAPSRPTETIED